MADPARPGGTDSGDDAVTILRRLEPVLQSVQDEQQRQGERLGAVEQRLSRIEGVLERTPTTWTIISIMLALVAAVFAGMGVMGVILT